MSTKRNVLMIALVQAALSGSVAFADAAPSGDANTSWQQSEAGVPDSTYYKDRVIPSADDSNTVWETAETSNPHSVNYKNRAVGKSRTPNADWEASEAGNPHNARAGKDAAKERQ